MKDMFKKNWARCPLGQAGRNAHISKCISAEMCPSCGSDIFIRDEVFDKNIGRGVFYECSACDWKNYDYADH